MDRDAATTIPNTHKSSQPDTNAHEATQGRKATNSHRRAGH
jgi:hypothetical protein